MKKSVRQILKNNRELTEIQEVQELIEYIEVLEESVLEAERTQKWEYKIKEYKNLVDDIYNSCNSILVEKNDKEKPNQEELALIAWKEYCNANGIDYNSLDAEIFYLGVTQAEFSILKNLKTYIEKFRYDNR